jgi:NAD(P)-dependent dehydrogenase (short-subunit alcohol dehydrogenase family)
MTQSLRALSAGQGVTVHAILTGPVDTDMTRSVDFPKASLAVYVAQSSPYGAPLEGSPDRTGDPATEG